MAIAIKKATFSLHLDVVEALDVAVRGGAAPSKNALVELALRKELKELRRQRERSQWAEAMKDPLFLRDLEEVEEAFRSADAETARRLV